MKTNTRFGLHSARNKVFRLCMGTSIMSIFALSLLTVFPYYQEYEKAMAEGAPNAVSSELNLNVTNNEANLHFSVTGGEYGSFASSGDAITFVASTNNNSGYTLRYVGSDDTGSLTHAEADFKFLSISGPLTANEFSALANTSYNNKWGFKPSKYVSDGIVINNTGDSGVFLPIPTTAGVVIDKTTQPKNNEEYSIEIGARVDLSIDAGEYVGNYNLVIIANPVSYRISYNAGNTTDAVTGLPEAQNSATSDTSIALASGTPTRAHHSFIGWCDVLPTTTNGTDSCTGTNTQTGNPAIQYAAGGEYGINQTTSNNATLYAMWQIDTFTCTKQYRLENADGTWGSYVADGTETINYGSTCSYSKSVTNYKNSANGTNGSTASTSATIAADTTLSLNLYRNTFTCSKQYRLQNVDGTFPSTYTADGSTTVRYGASCDYSKTVTNYKNAANGTNDAQASTSASNVTSNQTLSLDLYRNTFTCTNQYRLQNADGTFPSTYTADGSTTVLYDGSCSYTKTVTDYKRSAIITNGAAASIGFSNVKSNKTLSLDFYRNTYTLTVAKGTNISGTTGSGKYRWGQTATVGATKKTDVACTAYATPTWTASAGTAPAAGASSTYVMPKSDATVTASTVASKVAQTITLSRTDGAASIVINNTGYTGTSVQLYCGTYDISGTYSSGYGFTYWYGADGVAVASTTTPSTTMTVSGTGTLTLNSKPYLQNTTASTCSTTTTTVYDSRDEHEYRIQKLADGNCWLLDNLHIELWHNNIMEKITSSTTNASDITLNYLKNGGGTTSDQYATAHVIGRWDDDKYSVPQYIIGIDTQYGEIGSEFYYNYCAASAGSYCYGDETSTGTSSGNATEDICPKGWRMPTDDEYQALYNAYNSDYTSFVNALHFPLRGFYSKSFAGSSFLGRGSSGYFWSSTRHTDKSMGALTINESDMQASAGILFRNFGGSVRCVLK